MMTDQTIFRRLNRATFAASQLPFAAVAWAMLTLSAPAFAAGTLAGTDIDNIAEATYDTHRDR